MSMASSAPLRSTYSHRSFGKLSRAKLQKPQLALQALVRANSQRPGPPEDKTRRSVSQARARTLMRRLETFPTLETASAKVILVPPCSAERFECCMTVERTQNHASEPA